MKHQRTLDVCVEVHTESRHVTPRVLGCDLAKTRVNRRSQVVGELYIILSQS